MFTSQKTLGDSRVHRRIQVVWFKRDLRVVDHPALQEAAARGPVLPIYVFEEELWQQPDMSSRHFEFLLECIKSLRHALNAIRLPLLIRTGDMLSVLEEIQKEYAGKFTLWSHQETWNDWTYQRDIRIRQWCKNNEIPWEERAQHGVIRALKSRDGWAGRWERYMTASIASLPSPLAAKPFDRSMLPTRTQLGIASDSCMNAQRGGREEGLKVLSSFLKERGIGYNRGISSPLTAFSASSRISAYLAFGALSVREVFQATEKTRDQHLGYAFSNRKKWLQSLNAFSSRLRWHCHFIQKLEDQPSIEYKNLHAGYDGLREALFDEKFYMAWCEGRTGYPMIDACMRALVSTGWINFRMRAMLMSFCVYHLWLHWRKPSLHLARLFVDYEPGIHYCQAQMQSGTTGINTIRIYNPIKQGIDHDTDAHFIKQWVPELRDVPSIHIHNPSTLHSYCKAYPLPLVNEKQARKTAAMKIHSVRQLPSFSEKAAFILNKHGSRMSREKRKEQATSRRRPLRNLGNANPNQMELPL